MSKMSIRTMSKFLVFFLLFGIWGMGFSPADAAAKKFKDVGPKQSWALQDITKMSIKRIVEGTPDGQFLPDQAVSKEQAIAMVLNAMGYKDEVQTYTGKDYTSLYEGVKEEEKVSSWAKNYISLAHQEGLIHQDDGERFLGKYAGSREWVAQLLIRMIDKEMEALLPNSGKSRVFTDAKDISSWAVNYVNFAASDELNLISGFPNEDGTTFSFKPKASVTRAQLAVLISRAEKFLANPVGNELRGQVLSVGSEWLIDTKAGNRKLKINADTEIFKDYKKVSSSVLQRFQPIYVLYTPGEPLVADYIEILDESSAQEVTTGTVKKVVLNTLAVETSEGLENFHLPDNVVYGSIDGAVKTISDLNEGDTIELTLIGRTVTKVYRVDGNTIANSKGTIYDVDLDKGLFTLQLNDQTVMVYSLNNTATVQYPDQRTTGLAGLHKGMEVEIKLENNSITNVKVVTIVEQGKVISVSPDNTFITINSSIDQTAKVYTLASNAEIKLQDTIATSKEIQPGDDVKLLIGSTGSIQSLTITNRSLPTTTVTGDMIEGKVYSLDKASKIIMLENDKDGQKTYRPYEFGKTFDLYINGKWSDSLDDIKKDMRAKLQLYDGKITYLEIDNRLSGTVVRVDKDRRVLTLTQEDGLQVSYFVDNNYDVTIRHESGEDLSDIEQGDKVRVKLDDNNRITDIAVQRDFAYMVTDIYESSKKLYVENENGKEYSMTLNATVDLTIPGKSNPKISDFKKRDIVKATYLGDEIKALAVLPSYGGMVTSINTDKKEFTVLKNDGSSTTLPFVSGDVIQYKTNEYTQLSSLSVNDRVIVQSWLGGKKRLTKMEKLSGEYYYKDSNYIYVIEGVKSYKYASDLFVRGNDNRGITLDMLNKNDKITLYRLDGVVYEVHRTY